MTEHTDDATPETEQEPEEIDGVQDQESVEETVAASSEAPPDAPVEEETADVIEAEEEAESPEEQGEEVEAPEETLPDSEGEGDYAALAAEVELLHEELAGVEERCARIEDGVGEIGGVIAEVARSQQILPRQVRKVNENIEGIAHSLAEPRLRDLLKELIFLHDLLRTMGENADEDGPRDNYECLLTQITQMLQANGVEQINIDTGGAFDPSLHQALKAQPCESPEDVDTIAEVIRPGFKTENNILRYAEVVVMKEQTDDEEAEEPAEDNTDATDASASTVAE